MSDNGVRQPPARVAPSIASLAAAHGDLQVLPTSFGQQRFWLLDQLDDASAAYTIPLAVRLRGPLNANALQRALNAIIARHEALRTVFALENEAPVQVILPELHVPLAVDDLSSLDADRREAAVRERADANANARFDLAAGPLVHAALLRVAAHEHVLLLGFHHIVFDGWSVGLLYRELASAYEAIVSGAEVTLPALPLQYADYAVWQRKAMAGGAAARQLAYWKERLADVPAIELPTDRPRPAVQTASGGKRERLLAGDVVTAIRGLGRQEQATPYMTFLATFVALLHRYTAQHDITVGSITSGRRRPELESLIGLFLNTVAVRANVSGELSFVDLLRHVRERATDAYANQDVPFEQVVDAVQPVRDRSRSPIFQVAFQLLEGLGSALALPGIEAERVAGTKDTSKFDLTLMLHASDGGALRAVIEYNSDLFDSGTVDRMLAHYAALVAAVARTPTSRIDALPLLGPDEDAAVTERWNPASTPLPTWTAPARIIEHATARPDSVAVRAADATLSYGTLARQSAVVARALANAGVSAGDRVAVCMERASALVVALLGVHRAGAAYVPLDPAYPADRIAHVFGDAGVRAVITDSDMRGRLGATAAPIVVLDARMRAEAIDDAQAFRAPAAGADDPAYVIYTSGSTGLPKGVVIPHRALSNFLATMSERPGLVADDALVAVTTVSFDIAGLELWLPLVTGAEVMLATRETALDGVALRALVERTTERVARANRRAMLQATPATWRLLLEAGWQGASNLVILCGGEAWPPGLAESLLTRGAELWNVYGPTETTIWSSRARVTAGGPVALGEPLANTSLYVLEPSGEPAPLGVPGELWIGGAGLAIGYHNRPELTAERFVTHARFGRLYRTGDKARRRADGRLEYIGRLDDQVKLRGYRIELGEIESILSQSPDVDQAVVALRPLNGSDQGLVAYVTGTSAIDDGTLMSDLTERLRRALPEYMIPGALMRLDKMPLTPNGKVDRRALPAPSAGAAVAARPYVAPRSPLEAQIADVWAAVLGKDRVSVEDDFFSLGGHSLAAMRVIARLAQQSPARITIGTLFQARTVAALAAMMVVSLAHTEAAAGDADLAILLAELESMSDSDAAKLLGDADER